MNSELKRKTLHLALTGFPLAFYRIADFRLSYVLMVCGMGILWYCSEYIRIRLRSDKILTAILIRHMTRKSSDVTSIPLKHPNWLYAYMAIGILFSTPHIVNGVCVLTFGDAAASLLGKPGVKRSLRGTLAGFGVAVLACYLFSGVLVTALGASLLGMAAEAVPTRVKDNYTVPIFAALGSWATTKWILT
jgi:dolichol kinase